MPSYSSQKSPESDRSSTAAAADVDAQVAAPALDLGENQQRLTDGGAIQAGQVTAGSWGNLAALAALLTDDTVAEAGFGDFLGGLGSIAAQMGLSLDGESPSADVQHTALQEEKETAWGGLLTPSGAGLERLTREDDLAALADPTLSDADRAEIVERNGLAASSTTKVQVGGDSFALSHAQVDPTISPDGEVVKAGQTTSGQVSLGEGVHGQVQQQQTHADGSSSSTTVGGGLVAKADGELGVQGTVGGTTSLPGTDATVGLETTQSLTNHGLDRSAKRTYTDERGRQASLLTRGGVKVYTTQQDDGTFLLTCSVDAHATLGGKSEKEGGPGSLGASATVGGSLVYTHTLTAAEVERYTAAVEGALEGNIVTDGPPELGLIASLGLMADQGTDPLLAVGSASAAEHLAAGDSLTLTTDAGYTVEGSTAGPLSVGGKHASTLQRICEIQRVTDPKTGAPRVAVTVRFSSTTRDEASVTAAPDVGIEGLLEASGGASTEVANGMGRRFLLDPASPDYSAQYGEIVHAMTREQLDAVAAHIKPASTTGTSMVKDALEGGMRFLGISVTSSTESTVSEQVTEAAGRLTAATSGSQSDTGSVEVLGSAVAGGSQSGGLEGTLEDGAATVDLLTEESRRMLREAGAEGVAPADKGVLGWLWSIVSKPKGEVISSALTEVRRTVSMLRLSDSELDTIIARAGDKSGWIAATGCLSSMTALAPWSQLRHRLIAPIPAADHPDAELSDRLLLSQLRALASLVGATGQDGVSLLTAVARDWQGSGSREDLGTTAMFPPGIVGEQAAYYGFIEAVDAKRGADGIPTGLTAADLHSLLLEGGRLKVCVESCTAFTAARAKMEMLDALTLRMDRLHLAHLHIDGECAPAGAAMDPVIPQQQREIARLEGLLGGCKREEQALLATVGGSPRGQKQTTAMGARLDQVRDLYEHWIHQILALRTAYDALEQAVYGGLEGEGADGAALLPTRSIGAPGEQRSPALEPAPTPYFDARIALNAESMAPGLQAEDREMQAWLARY